MTDTRTERRTRITAATEQQRVVQAAAGQAGPIGPPGGKLDAATRRIFDAIVATRPRIEWRAYDIEAAVDLARAERRLQETQRMLAREGEILVRGPADDCVHVLSPRVKALQSLWGIVQGMRRSLGLNATAAYRAENNERRWREGARVEQAAQAASASGEKVTDIEDARMRFIKRPA